MSKFTPREEGSIAQRPTCIHPAVTTLAALCSCGHGPVCAGSCRGSASPAPPGHCPPDRTSTPGASHPQPPLPSLHGRCIHTYPHTHTHTYTRRCTGISRGKQGPLDRDSHQLPAALTLGSQGSGGSHVPAWVSVSVPSFLLGAEAVSPPLQPLCVCWAPKGDPAGEAGSLAWGDSVTAGRGG